MDELTRERFDPYRTINPPRPVSSEEWALIEERRAVLLGVSESEVLAEQARTLRLGALRRARERRLVKAIRRVT